MASLRVGLGMDVHAVGSGDHVMLGGVRVPYTQGVVAHSDGDVLLHALCDALLGAAALGDIGQHFPDTDPRYRGICSLSLLAEVWSKVSALGFSIHNIDVTVLAEAPKLAPHRDAITQSVANALQLQSDQVNIKATTTEKLGFVGRREGLAAQVVVLLERA